MANTRTTTKQSMAVSMAATKKGRDCSVGRATVQPVNVDVFMDKSETQLLFKGKINWASNTGLAIYIADTSLEPLKFMFEMMHAAEGSVIPRDILAFMNDTRLPSKYKIGEPVLPMELEAEAKPGAVLDRSRTVVNGASSETAKKPTATHREEPATANDTETEKPAPAKEKEVPAVTTVADSQSDDETYATELEEPSKCPSSKAATTTAGQPTYSDSEEEAEFADSEEADISFKPPVSSKRKLETMLHDEEEDEGADTCEDESIIMPKDRKRLSLKKRTMKRIMDEAQDLSLADSLDEYRFDLGGGTGCNTRVPVDTALMGAARWAKVEKYARKKGLNDVLEDFAREDKDDEDEDEVPDKKTNAKMRRFLASKKRAPSKTTTPPVSTPAYVPKEINILSGSQVRSKKHGRVENAVRRAKNPNPPQDALWADSEDGFDQGSKSGDEETDDEEFEPDASESESEQQVSGGGSDSEHQSSGVASKLVFQHVTTAKELKTQKWKPTLKFDDSEKSFHRLAGDRPLDPRQQLDATTRKKLNSVQQNMECLHRMTTPLVRSDSFDSLNESPEYVAKRNVEKKFPWVMPFAGCYTEQPANGDGHNKAGVYLDVPEIHFFVHSEAAQHKMEEALRSGSIKVVTHNDFQTYSNAFSSGVKREK